MITYLFESIVLNLIWYLRLFLGNFLFLIIGLKPKCSMYANPRDTSDLFGVGYIQLGKKDPYYTGNKAYVFPVSTFLWSIYFNRYQNN